VKLWDFRMNFEGGIGLRWETIESQLQLLWWKNSMLMLWFKKGQSLHTLSCVRGKAVPLDVATINSFLGIHEANAPCEYMQYINIWYSHTEIERVVCLLGGTFVRNMQQLPLHIEGTDVTYLATNWVTFIHSNISPLPMSLMLLS